MACVELETNVNRTIYTFGTYAVISIGVVSNVWKAVIAGTSPQGAWAIINQLQLVVLLPLMFGNFNTKVRNFI